jgi:UDP-N-acetylglucosamine--N-acetylmuramyl-(pentapeptide) pyrophosphoryl-undecaprenol N-acetylglucosamine transferase
MGGFVTGPGGVMARLTGRPLLVHEQNAIAGLSNRLLARLASGVYEAFPNSFRRGRATTIGNPVRASIAALRPPAERFAGRPLPLRLLVLGGSLGARSLNTTVPAALAALPPDGRPQVRHQAGERGLEEAREAYARHGVVAQVDPFIEDMAAAYGWADLVICRAGALTIAELTAAGVGAVLVPYPHAVDDHQAHNARLMVDAGAALLVRDEALVPGDLATLLRELLADRGRCQAMAEQARELAFDDAAALLGRACLDAAAAAAGGAR